MEIDKHLSIVIPTYNRADFLDYSLEIHIPVLKKYNIQIFISDNASNDNTQKVVEKWMEEYSLLRYNRNDTNIGPDGNFEKALKLPDTEYIWLLSDTYQLPKKGIEYFFKLVKNSSEKFDLIVFNLENKIKIPTKNYRNQNELLADLCATMTCAAVNIYNKKLIEEVDFYRYYNSYFLQTGIIFEYISNKNFNVHWVKEYSLTMIKHPFLKKTNWSHTSKAFEIGCEHWTNFVMSLPPSYLLSNKMKVSMDFGKVSGLFTLKNLVLLRIDKLLNITVFNNYKTIFPLCIDYPLFFILIISLTPIVIFKMIAIITIVILKKDKKLKIINLFKSKYEN